MHELDTAWNLSGRFRYVLLDLPYNVERYEQDGQAEYDVFGSSNRKEMTKDLVELIRLRAHLQVLCYAPWTVLLYNVIGPLKDKEVSITTEYPNAAGSANKDGESVELRPRF